MGLHSFNIGSMLLIVLVVALLFGTKRLRRIGEDLGAAFKSFRKGVDESKDDEPTNKPS